jgi:RNA polymerase sigma-70 factor, ECF subfamily
MGVQVYVPATVSQLHHTDATEACSVFSEAVQSSNPRADAAMDRYAAGDQTAFGELYDALAPRMYAFILRKVGNIARAEDLVQQTLLKLHCARSKYVRGSCVTPWAFSILRRLYLDQERRKKLEVLSTDGSSGVNPASPGANPEESAASKQQLQILVDSAASQLSPAQQLAFELVHYAQMSHAEAAEALGTTVASVKLRMQRANQAIRAALDSANSGGKVS